MYNVEDNDDTIVYIYNEDSTVDNSATYQYSCMVNILYYILYQRYIFIFVLSFIWGFTLISAYISIMVITQR